MPGPPPGVNSRRRNSPTIVGTPLPAEGREGRPPTCPYKLGPAGKKWWRHAWKLPQATQWGDSFLYAVGRRAQLEDELDAIKFRDELDLTDLLAGADKEAIRRVSWALEQLKRSASGSTTLNKEMDQLDDRLGLNPKAMAALRWTIAAPAEREADVDENVAQIDDYRSRVG